MSEVRRASSSRVEVWAIYGGNVLYAQRPTREEADVVVAEQAALIRKFGPPRIEAKVVNLGASRPRS